MVRWRRRRRTEVSGLHDMLDAAGVLSAADSREILRRWREQALDPECPLSVEWRMRVIARANEVLGPRR